MEKFSSGTWILPVCWKTLILLEGELSLGLLSAWAEITCICYLVADFSPTEGLKFPKSWKMDTSHLMTGRLQFFLDWTEHWEIHEEGKSFGSEKLLKLSLKVSTNFHILVSLVQRVQNLTRFCKVLGELWMLLSDCTLGGELWSQEADIVPRLLFSLLAMALCVFWFFFF